MDPLLSHKKASKFKSEDSSFSSANSRLNVDSVLRRYLRRSPPMTSTGFKGIDEDSFFSPAVSVKSSVFSSRNLRRSFTAPAPPTFEKLLSTPAFGTPVKVVDEDVLVMDGILVDSVTEGRVSRTMSSYSGSSSLKSASSAPRLRSREDYGPCRLGLNWQAVANITKCRGILPEEIDEIAMRRLKEFPQGNEELSPTYFPTKNKTKAHPLKPNVAGSLLYGQKSPFFPPPGMTEAAASASQPASASKSEYKYQRHATTVNAEYPGKNTSSIPMLNRTPAAAESHASSTSHITYNSQDWSPSDDSIEVALPGDIEKGSSARKDTVACIHRILHGPRTSKRLPVFTEFCED